MNKFVKTGLALGLAASTLAITADESFARNRTAYCQSYARDASRHVGGDQVATGLVAGAAVGGIAGALVGGNAFVPGLAIGAVGGTMVGAASGSERRRHVYWAAYNDCMHGHY